MARVAPFHSSNIDDPDVYHECSNCGPGQAIPTRNNVNGKGSDHRPCDVCAVLIRNGSC